MPAEYVFAGGRLDSVVNVSGATESASAGVRDTTYTDAAIALAGTTAAFEFGFYTAASSVLSSTTIVSGESLWFHLEYCSSGNTGTLSEFWSFYDSSGVSWFRLQLSVTNTFQFQYNSGTSGSPVWTNVGSTWVLPTGDVFAIDVKVTLGSPHSFEFYYKGSLILSGSFTQASLTNLAKIRCRGASSTMYYSQLIVTRDISTIGAKVRYSRPTANGVNTAWTGVFSDVGEQIGSDSTLNTSTSAGQKETHGMSDVTLPAGFVIPTVFHWMRAKNNGAAPTNIKSVLRSGGVDYSTGNLSGIGTGFAAIGARYNTDPATATAWGQTSFNALEAGYESAA